MEITAETEAESSRHRQQQQLQCARSVAMQVSLSINELQETQAQRDDHQQQTLHADERCSVINDMLSQVHLSFSPPYIFRVPDSVRGVNPHCYTPRLVSIGPLHRKNPQLKPTKSLKIRLFKNFLDRQPTSEYKLQQMGLLVAKYESEIRKHYSPYEIKLFNSDRFCRMILVDATFIVELLVMKGEGNPMTEKSWLFGDLLNDLLLIENQIPLFIIYEIYLEFYKEDNSLCERYGKKDLFLNRIHKFINNVKNEMSTDNKPFSISMVTLSSMPEGYPLHFIDYMRQMYGFGVSNSNDIMKFSPVNPKPEEVQLRRYNIKEKQKILKHVQLSLPGFITRKEQVLEDGQQSRLKSRKVKEHVLEDGMSPSSLEEDRRPNKPFLPPKKKKNWKSDVVTASRLLKYGVRFEEGTTTALKDITFNLSKGILKINKVVVNESTENIFRNIVAYEQCDLVSETYVSDYLVFMDSLIDTPEDVNILIDAGIIQNDLRDDEKVSQMFNTLHKEVIVEGKDYLFAAQSHELNDYRRNLWHRWRATWYNWMSILKRDYFNSPWSTLAFISAAMLVGLTIVQTICSVYQAMGIKMQ